MTVERMAFCGSLIRLQEAPAPGAAGNHHLLRIDAAPFGIDAVHGVVRTRNGVGCTAFQHQHACGLGSVRERPGGQPGIGLAI